ncbi:phosphotransferase family protein [Amycolatopsis sp. NBC_01480]|uniref:phosphotransferase family protein n=1 Tax=Amycolatopsis sp. NBC_01480 TaxID=2903562 RepID=UPI002E29C9D2|nr:phosphotransferase [Amycolatopsis sp. NBC_01480]
MPQQPIANVLLAELRARHRRDPRELDHDLPGLGLRRLSGGRNNWVFGWDDSPGDPVCLKLYRADRGDRARAEYAALRHLASHGHTFAPRPLWHAPDDSLPAVAMTLIPGRPIPTLAQPAQLLPSIVEVQQLLRASPLGPFAREARGGSATSILNRIAAWSTQLEHDSRDPRSKDLQRLLATWRTRADGSILAEPAPPVLSRGDSNLDKWHYHDTGVYLLDWELTGHSDTAYDTAGLVEHPSARAIDDHTWAQYLPALGIDTPLARRRFLAAQRTIALHRLAVLWTNRDTLSADTEYQAMRVRDLCTSDFT